jgi:hypothetical protein
MVGTESEASAVSLSRGMGPFTAIESPKIVQIGDSSDYLSTSWAPRA